MINPRQVYGRIYYWTENRNCHMTTTRLVLLCNRIMNNNYIATALAESDGDFTWRGRERERTLPANQFDILNNRKFTPW
jgi:hypothetical protein